MNIVTKKRNQRAPRQRALNISATTHWMRATTSITLPASPRRLPFHNNQYGASLGGPIVKDKTFFFFDYEGQREPVGVVTIANVPNTGYCGPNGQLSPADSSNPVIQALLARDPWPAPNLPNPSGTPYGQASVVSPSFNELTSLIAKIDHSFNPDNLLTGRYFFGDSIQSYFRSH